MIVSSILKRLYYFVLTLTLLVSLSSCSTNKHSDNVYFIEYFYQAGKPDAQYILENYSRSALLSPSDLQHLLTLVDSHDFDISKSEYMASTLILDREGNRSVRLGDSISCLHLIIQNDESMRCDREMFDDIWLILSQYNEQLKDK